MYSAQYGPSMQQPMYSNVQPNLQHTGMSTGVKLLLAVVVVVVLVYLLKPEWLTSVKTTVVDLVSPDPTKSVEVAAESSPTPAPVVIANPVSTPTNAAAPTILVQAPIPIPAVVQAQVSAPAVDQNLVASIVFTKNSAGQSMPAGENNDWRTFQIGELKAYDVSGRMLTNADFSSVVYNTAAYDNNYYPAGNIIDNNPNTFIHTSGLDPVHQMTLTLKTPINVSRLQVLNRADCCQTRLNGTVCELKRTNGTLIKQFVLTSDLVQNLTN